MTTFWVYLAICTGVGALSGSWVYEQNLAKFDARLGRWQMMAIWALIVLLLPLFIAGFLVAISFEWVLSKLGALGRRR